MSDGLYHIKVHGIDLIVNIIGGKPHIPGEHKGKPAWCETVMEESRMEKLRPLADVALVRKVGVR